MYSLPCLVSTHNASDTAPCKRRHRDNHELHRLSLSLSSSWFSQQKNTSVASLLYSIIISLLDWFFELIIRLWAYTSTMLLPSFLSLHLLFSVLFFFFFGSSGHPSPISFPPIPSGHGTRP